ncbi:ABC-F type ribosomal protection protein [Clostridium sp. D2Q-11]|uniref:ABC-F type ribosomal protection protein n=1 Tax=Anaeromonas frigoriresistens TaxID=2683708 RepID=A0A942UW66_9FIRM|nr:ABC-F type ribosomal protection protein [Anaeromonas frigoriresistens]MBS4537934.1 ABC-F type ribosomal protection protein [Anaeromonas frigoriresistens]
MIILEGKNIKKYYGERKILDIKNIRIYEGDRIGVVGVNGSGKTTLMNILSMRDLPDEGDIDIKGKISYITQLGTPENKEMDYKLKGEFKVDYDNRDTLSGGEKTRFKLAEGLSTNPNLLLLDEPTSNLDIDGINVLTEKLQEFQGAILIISHDRNLLDNIVDKIIEVEDGEIKEYSGNYSDYKEHKEAMRVRQEFEYEKYVKEKGRLTQIIQERQGHAKTMKKTPTRMGNSEARLHRANTRQIQGKIHNTINAIETRIEKLDKKEKPKEIERVKIDMPSVTNLRNRLLIDGNKISKSFGDKILFKNSELKIFNGDKAALLGNNGTGKTTLINMILEGDEKLKICKNLKVGYFSQKLDILEGDKTILENVMKNSIQNETTARTLLSRLLFKREDIKKNIEVLSGGERVKVAFAKIFLSDINFIILDEPTNYLDIPSIEALEEVLLEYEGSLLLVTHDKTFIDRVANKIITIEDKKIRIFNGWYSEYIERQENKINFGQEEDEKKLLVLQNRMSEVMGKLSLMPSDEEKIILDKEFNQLVKEINSLKIKLG